jgi:hypothetical protein
MLPVLPYPSGSDSAWTPAQLFPGAGAWYDPSNLSSMFQEIASPVTPTTPGSVIGTIRDLSGNGHHGVSPTNAQRPLLNLTGGVYAIQPNNANNTGFQLDSVAWNSIYIAAAVIPQAAINLETLFSSLPETDAADIRRDFLTGAYRSGANPNTNFADFTNGGGFSWINGVSGFAFSGAHLAEFQAVSSLQVNNLLCEAAAGRGGSWFVAGAVMLNRVPSGGEQANIRTYLGAKIGLSL